MFLGEKINRRAQVLGSKIQSKARMLGQKANQALRISDSGLRKIQNTLQNKIIPASTLLLPEYTAPAVMALGGVKALRSSMAPAKQVSDRLEKLNLRKEAENLAQKLTERGQNNDFV